MEGYPEMDSSFLLVLLELKHTMNRTIAFFTLFLIFQHSQVIGQDPMFSQHLWNELQLNSAAAGNGKQENRLYAIYRDQWRKAPIPFMTAHFSYDRRLMLKSKNHQLGLGGQFLYDRAGTAALSHLQVEGLFSYTLLLSESRQKLSFGLGVGLGNRSINGG